MKRAVINNWEVMNTEEISVKAQWLILLYVFDLIRNRLE